jgi:hypothetical protein
LYIKEDLADIIKLRLSKKVAYLGLSTGLNVVTRVIIKCRQEDQSQKRCENEEMRERSQVKECRRLLKAWKNEERDSPLESPEKCS